MSDEPKPSLRPTAPSTLTVTALAAGAAMLLLVTRHYEIMPATTWYAPAGLTALAAILAYTAYGTGRRVRRVKGAPPPDPILAARLAALAKAASIAAALFGGAFAGLLVYVLTQQRLTAAQAETPAVIFWVVSCALLLAAAQWLERSCRIPDDEEPPEDDQGAKA